MKFFRNFSIVGLALLTLFFVACSSDDDNNVSTDGLNLEGEWQFKTMNFLDESVKWDPELDYTSANTFGYAPYMFDYAGATGMIFSSENVISDSGENLGKRFDYVLTGNFGQDPDEAYWYWNYTNDKQSFMMQQVNPSFPPHDYTISNISDVEVSQDGKRVDFKGYLKSRKVGGTMMEIEEVPVEFSLLKGAPDTAVEILIEGEPFVAPQ